MNIALVLSGGKGERVHSDVPKQYISIERMMIVTRTIQRLYQSSLIDALQIVAEKDWRLAVEREMQTILPKTAMEAFRGFSSPGGNRQLSIWNGLCDIKQYAAESDLVLVFDAARPCVSKEQIEACIAACEGHDGAMPILPVKDTVYISRDGKRVTELLDRSLVFAGQAPEAFSFGKYLEANKCLLPDKIWEINGSTEAAILGNMDIVMFPGDERNFKITTDEDLNRYRGMIRRKEKE